MYRRRNREEKKINRSGVAEMGRRGGGRSADRHRGRRICVLQVRVLPPEQAANIPPAAGDTLQGEMNMEAELPEWEEVDESQTTCRLKIKGGWLYKVIELDRQYSVSTGRYVDVTVGVSVVFVPD